MTSRTVVVAIVAGAIVLWATIMISEGKSVAGVLLVALIGAGCAALGVWIGLAAVSDKVGNEHETTSRMTEVDSMPNSRGRPNGVTSARNALLACLLAAGVIAFGSLRNVLSSDKTKVALGVGQALIFVPILLYFGIRNYRKMKTHKAQFVAHSKL